MLKFVLDVFGVVFLLFMLLTPLFLLLGAVLIWKGSGIVRGLGWLLIFLVAYYRLSWISPWYVIKGSDRVQEYKLHDVRFGVVSSVRWMEASNQLLLTPPEEVGFSPQFPEYGTHVLVVDLETRQNYWEPITTVNLDATRKIESLFTDYGKQRDGLNVYYASPSQEGSRAEFSFIGFSLPILGYNIPFPFGETSGWQWGRNYFGWKRLVVRESESSSVVVELNKIVFNDDEQRLYGGASAWVMEGEFFIIEPPSELRVLVLGPFNTSQNTQSDDNNKE